MKPNAVYSRNWLMAGAAAVFGVASLQGCMVEAEHSHGSAVAVYDGTLTVDWTIERAKDTFDCDANDATEVVIDVTTLSGRPVQSVSQDCGAFEATVSLEPGDYAGSAVIVDPGGFERTTAVDLGEFSIFEDEDTLVAINFPFDSFR